MWLLKPCLSEKIKRSNSCILTSIYEMVESLGLKQNIIGSPFVSLYSEMFFSCFSKEYSLFCFIKDKDFNFYCKCLLLWAYLCKEIQQPDFPWCICWNLCNEVSQCEIFTSIFFLGKKIGLEYTERPRMLYKVSACWKGQRKWL